MAKMVTSSEEVISSEGGDNFEIKLFGKEIASLQVNGKETKPQKGEGRCHFIVDQTEDEDEYDDIY